MRRMISVWHQSTARVIREQMDPYAFESLLQYLDVIHWSFCASPLQVEHTLCVMLWLVALVMCLVSHWLVCVMWPLLFGVYSPCVAFRLVRLHAVPQRSAAAWQKQCILVRTFVRLWSALQPPYDHMCHQSTARAKRDQPPRSGAAVAQNRLREPWWRHTLFSLVRFCDNKHEVCCMFILTIQFQ